MYSRLCAGYFFFLRLSMPDDLMGNLNANAEKWTEWKRIAYCLPAYLILSVLSLLSYVYPRCRLVYYISRPFICAHIAAYAYYIHKVGIYGPIVLLLPSVSFMSGGRRKKHFYIFLLHPNRIGCTFFSIFFFLPWARSLHFSLSPFFYFFGSSSSSPSGISWPLLTCNPAALAHPCLFFFSGT